MHNTAHATHAQQVMALLPPPPPRAPLSSSELYLRWGYRRYSMIYNSRAQGGDDDIRTDLAQPISSGKSHPETILRRYLTEHSL